MSKDSLIKGTVILAAAAFIARFLGLVQRVPLKHVLGDTGMATYGIAYNIYFALLIIATAGIPSALSKLISEHMALGQVAEAQKIFRAAIFVAIGAGLTMTAILYATAPYYAIHISRDHDAALAIRALAPALLLFPLIAMMRGYFQGRQMMIAGGLSQIVEQIARVITAVGLAFMLLWLGYSHEWAVAGASFGGVTGGIGALVVMIYFWRRLRKSDDNEQNQRQVKFSAREGVAVRSRGYATLSLKTIYSMIFTLSIPISLISLAVPIVYLIDSSTVIALLEGQMGYEQAKESLGILVGRAQSIAGIPPILAIALSMSIIPVISAAFARQDNKELQVQASQALRLSVLSALPFVVILSVIARPVNELLFGDALGTSIIIWLVVGSMFQVMMMVSGSILMGLGQTRAPMLHVFIGLGIKLAGGYILAPWLGIYGIIIATSICFIVIMQLNLTALKKTVHYTVLGRAWLAMAMIVIIMVGLGVGLEWLANAYIHPAGRVVNYFLHCMLIGTALIILYPLLLFKLRIVTVEDMQHLPLKLRKPITKIAGRIRRKTV